MKKILQNLLFYANVIIIVYLISSIIHLSWYIANPQGFFGLNYFIEVIRMVLTILIVLVILIFGFFLLVSSLVSLLRGKSTIKSVLQVIGIILFMAFMTLFNSLWVSGASYLFASELSEKYSLINRTEKYLKNGEVNKALEFATKSYLNEQNRNLGWFFIFTKLYSYTDFDKKEKLISKYSATLNYGYALKGITTNGQTGEEKFKEAITIANAELLKDNRDELLIFPTLSIAEINLYSEKFKIADKYLNDLFKLQEQNKTDEDAFYLINTYILFAAKASAIGDQSKSIKLQQESLRIYEKTDLEKDSRNYLSLLLAVSAGELFNENFTSAADLLMKAQPIAEELDHTSFYLNFLLVKGQYCLVSALNKQGDERIIEKSFWANLTSSDSEKLTLERKLLNQAEDCFIELLESSEDIAGRNSFDYLNAALTLANYYYTTSQFDKAKLNYDLVLSSIKSSRNENQIFYYETYLKSLLNESQIDRVNIDKLAEIEDFIFNKLSRNFSVLAEEEKEIYTMRMQNYLNAINYFYVLEDSETSRKRLYNNIMYFKSLALSSNKAVRNFIKNSNGDLELRYAQLLKEKKEFKIKSLTFNNLQDENELILKEKKILQQVYSDPNFKPYQSIRVDWKNIKSALMPNEVAIEFINLPVKNGNEKNSQYYALLLASNYSSPKLVKLFNENDLKDLLNIQGDTKTRVNSIYNKNHTKLYNLIFAPLDQFLEENSTVYVSKTGLLHNISFSAITKDNLWDIHILQNTKYIVEKNELKKTSNAVLYGGIDYNINPDSIVSKSRANNTLNRKFKNLNYTMSEVINISKLFSKDTSITSKMYVKNKATELSFRKLSGSETNIIHIATHGYYNKKDGLNSFTDYGIYNSQIELSPLLRSGLLFAGANNSISAANDNDGIMTSLEISEMDFSRVNLVVLSACETGLGDVLGSEGVFGLQRAFKLAGAKSLIVSLWQVPDKQTAELMLKFYNFYLDGHSKTEALKKAQNSIRKEYPNPYYWAGFELIQ